MHTPAGDPGDPNEFGMLLVRPTGALALSGGSPNRDRFAGVNGYWLMPPQLRIFMKVDRRPFGGTFSGAQVGEGRPVVVMHRPAHPSDLRDAVDIVAPHESRIRRILGQ